MIRCLGKHAAMFDPRMPRFAAHAGGLPAPPRNANWYADVPEWGMLGNDNAGDCVFAAMLHWIMQQSAYLNPGHGLIPTDADALAAYSAVTGYDPKRPETDQGTIVAGPAGALQFWHDTGIESGGAVHKIDNFMSVSTTDPTRWKQAIQVCGGLLTGLMVPKHIAEAEELPFVWDNPAGVSAGGHEILLVGYEELPNGTLYDFVSWGQLCRATERFLLTLTDEMNTIYSKESINARGVNSAGMVEADILSDMQTIRASA